ncbi:DNA primase [Yonghaparkia sp. Soil809]|uniref:DNA primase n=1 Tax=Yonghaparkia sp. Soil809 TaxID=1736417 RepID=UPI0006F7CCE7|nr:DNA primase [Yonghaparkia sp. Soil809]KRF31176.1 DNA primase [Yonghaparkia sp. Soil809]
MAGLIRRSDIDEVRSRTNIGEIVGEYVTLKGAGIGSMKGLCPFHDERSPSFHVRPQVGFYHCFGCGEGGDVFSFLQKMDHVTFSEAVERLAQRLNYTLTYEDGGQAREDGGSRRRILAANEAAEAFFREQLQSPAAEPARAFLGERGFDPAAAARFSIGFAPNSYDALSGHLLTKGFTIEELLAAGLVGQGDRGPYDRFRGRLIWPIKDVTGQTLGFGARKLLETDQGPKYLNTPETAVYHKSQVLYGLDLAKRDIARGKQVVVVEGYTDVMACHLAGVTTAVATCGTAFGVDHIKVIRRVMGDTDNADTTQLGEVIFTFDPDEAGQKAASRAFAEEQRFAAQTFVAVAPDGLDPCDLRLKRGDDAIRMLVSGRKPMYEFMVRRRLDQFDLETVEGRVGALRAAAPVVAGIRDQSMQSGYARTLAGWIGMEPAEVSRAVQAARRASGARPAPGRGASEPGRGAAEPGRGPSDPGPTGGGATGRSTAGAPQGDRSAADAPPPEDRGYAPPSISMSDLPGDPVTRLERELLMAVLQHPGEIDREIALRALHTSFTVPALSTVRDALVGAFEHYGTDQWVARAAEEAPGAFAPLVMQLAIAPLPIRGDHVREYCTGVTTSLIERDLLRRKTELLGALQRTDASGDPERYRTLQRQLVDLETERRRIRGD